MKFKVGEICVGQRFDYDTDRNGVECEVQGYAVGGGTFYHTPTKEPWAIKGPAYRVRWADGEWSWVAEFNLKKKPPKEKLGSWSRVEKLCGWNPSKQPA